MSRWSILLGAGLLASRVFAGEVAPAHGTNFTLSSFELKDQHQQTHHFTFPRTNLLVLTVADQKGSAQVAAWVRPLKERFPQGLPIEGVADVSSVPGFLRPLVRREFKTQFEHPVMLDWSGKFVRQLPCAPDAANVFLVATNGTVLRMFQGAVEANKLAVLFRLIEAQGIGAASVDVNAARTMGGVVVDRTKKLP